MFEADETDLQNNFLNHVRTPFFYTHIIMAYAHEEWELIFYVDVVNKYW